MADLDDLENLDGDYTAGLDEPAEVKVQSQAIAEPGKTKSKKNLLMMAAVGVAVALIGFKGYTLFGGGGEDAPEMAAPAMAQSFDSTVQPVAAAVPADAPVPMDQAMPFDQLQQEPALATSGFQDPATPAPVTGVPVGGAVPGAGSMIPVAAAAPAGMPGTAPSAVPVAAAPQGVAPAQPVVEQPAPQVVAAAPVVEVQPAPVAKPKAVRKLKSKKVSRKPKASVTQVAADNSEYEPVSGKVAAGSEYEPREDLLANAPAPVTEKVVQVAWSVQAVIPGRAWLRRGEEAISVAVGDTVPGKGKVTGIDADSGVVSGAKYQIQ